MQKSIRFWDPGREYRSQRVRVLDIIDQTLSRGDIILRGDVDEFEKNFAKFVGTKYAVGVASGTDALILSMVALGIGPGDEVITTSYTFRATIEAIVHAGATPVLVDYGEDWRLKKTAKTKAIIPCHLEGAVMNWLPDEGILMIEDACQAIGASPVFGKTACYSFYPAKILGCYGDGGAIATNDEALYEKLRIMRNHFKGDWGPVGYNSRLDNVQAAILNEKLFHLKSLIAKRKRIAERYDRELENVGKPPVREVYQDYVITHFDRDDLYEYLKKHGIETMKNDYPFPTIVEKGSFAKMYESISLRIPCNPHLTDDEVTHVIETINSYGNYHGR